MQLQFVGDYSSPVCRGYHVAGYIIQATSRYRRRKKEKSEKESGVGGGGGEEKGVRKGGREGERE